MKKDIRSSRLARHAGTCAAGAGSGTGPSAAPAPAAAAPAPRCRAGPQLRQPAAAAAPAATAAPAPTPNKGDVAWMLTSTAFVLMMSVPALALFYGGMVRSKNVLSVLMQVFVVFSLISVLWCVYGYSLAFTEGNAYFGSFDRLFLKGTFDSSKGEFAMAATFSKNTPIPELVYVAFQATFAAITGVPRPGRVRRSASSSRRSSCSRCCGSRSRTCRSRTWSGSGPAAIRN